MISGTRPSLRREVLLGLGLFAVYLVVDLADRPGRHSYAADNGRAIYDLERWLHLDVEPALNRWLADQGVLRAVANYEYAVTYVATALAVLVWVYWRRPDVYRWARTTFGWVNLVAVACFAVYPVAPPRLLADLGFVDTVRLGHTWGSWGTPLVGNANQLAAMPSLHVAWAVWVSVVLARLSARPLTQLVSALHILVTTYVILATANHFLLDAVAGAVLVWVCGWLVARHHAAGARVPAADAFFLHVESPAAPQHVGGLVLLDTSGGTPTREDVVAVVRAQLGELPRYRQRLSEPSRWRRPRWVDHPDVDWDWHVVARDVTAADGRPGGERALHAVVAEIASTRLPRDRPLWRLVLVTGVGPYQAGLVLVMHHVVADGIGTVAQALHLLEPRLPSGGAVAAPRPGIVRTALGTVVGLGQLALDGRPSGRLPNGGTPERRFATVILPLEEARAIATRYGARVSDVLLTGVAGALRRVRPTFSLPKTLRVAVPLMARDPTTAAEGNVTAAVMTDVPLGPMAETDRLCDIAAHNRVLRTPTRVLASRFVMRWAGELLPPPAYGRFARTVYGGRFFHAIVSNMPGPDRQLTLAGAPLAAVFPILPLAPGVPLTVGALGWNGTLGLGIAADPALLDDAEKFAAAFHDVLGDLRRSLLARRTDHRPPCTGLAP